MCRLEYRKAPREDILKVVLSDDIHRRLDYEDFNKVPLEVGNYWGAYLDGDIISLLVKVKTYHFYVLEDYRHLSRECLKLFEKHHDIVFPIPERRFRDVILFLMRNGYKKTGGVFRKCHS